MAPRDPAVISYTMSHIRGKNTGIEVSLRKELWRRGLCYRHNTRYIYGRPDISFKQYKVVVFCDSEFWHGYHFSENQKQIKSHLDYWIPKIERNIARDEEVNSELKKEGYLVIRFWGSEIEQHVTQCADKIEAALKSRGYKKGSSH